MNPEKNIDAKETRNLGASTQKRIECIVSSALSGQKASSLMTIRGNNRKLNIFCLLPFYNATEGEFSRLQNTMEINFNQLNAMFVDLYASVKITV